MQTLKIGYIIVKEQPSIVVLNQKDEEVTNPVFLK